MEQGITSGTSTTTFSPEASCTRAQVATILFRLLDESVRKEYLTESNTFTDVASNYWAADEILRAAALGWVQGYQDGSYRPNNSITRAQVVTMINRVLCRMPEENADLLKGMTSFTDCAEGDWCYLAIQEATNSHDYKAKSGSIYEAWTDLNTAPDWSKFEH